MIIGLCGYGRSGKDSLAEVLIEECGFTRYAFADKVRDLALAIDPWVEIPYQGVRRLAYVVKDLGWERAKAYPDVRTFLQRLGTDTRKIVDGDAWLDALARRIDEEQPDNAVITDARFPNEAEWVKDFGHLIRVMRPGVGPVNGHESETAIDHIEAYEFSNAGTLDDLRFYGQRLPVQLAGG
jgi:hypothetical protein